MKRSRRLAALWIAAIAAGTAVAARAAAPVSYVEIGSIGSPGSASQLIYASAYDKLILRNGGSAVIVLDLADGSTETFYSHTLFTDMSLSPSGRYVFVADYGNENIGYGTPQTPSYVGRLDLATGSWESKSAGSAVAYHVEAVDDDHFILTSLDQWITFTYDSWGTGTTITILTPGSSFFPIAYYGDVEYDGRTRRLIHGNSGLSSQEISAYKLSGNDFTRQETSGIYGSASYQGGTAVLAVDGSAFYYGALQVDALDVTHNRHIFPELIYAANGRAALGNGNYYDPASGALLGSLGFATTVYAPNRSGNDFWAYDPTSDMLRHFFASDEPLPNGPMANADHARLGPGDTADLDVLANDFGFESPVTVEIATAADHGTTTVTGSPGDASGIRIHYVPDPGFFGSDRFVYTVTDGTTTDSATVTIAVDAFRAHSDAYILSRNIGSTALYVALNDTGFENPVTLTVTSQPAHGNAYAGQSSGSANGVYITYYSYYSSPAADYVDSFSYEISDGVHTDTATVSLELFVLKALDDDATTPVDTPVGINVSQNDISPYGVGLTVGLFETARHGTVRSSGSLMTYTPDPGFVGTDSFIYALDDQTHVSFGTVTVFVIHDADDDDVADEVDNCTFEPNSDQRDSDSDGNGSACDADLDNDGIVNFRDLALFRLKFGTADADADFDGSGIVNFDDLTRLRGLFLEPPGPSRVTLPVPEPGGSAAAAVAFAAIAACIRLRRPR